MLHKTTLPPQPPGAVEIKKLEAVLKLTIDMAAKRRKNKISGLVISMCYNEQKLKFSLFTNPSILSSE